MLSFLHRSPTGCQPFSFFSCFPIFFEVFFCLLWAPSSKSKPVPRIFRFICFGGIFFFAPLSAIFAFLVFEFFAFFYFTTLE